jgi:hypothetical protein
VSQNLAVKPSGDFGRVCRFKKQRERLDEVGSRFFNRRTLARDIEFRTQRHKTVVLTFDNCGQALRWLHAWNLQQIAWKTVGRPGGVRDEMRRDGEVNAAQCRPHRPRSSRKIRNQSARNAFNGEIELARNAGIRAAVSAEKPRTKIDVAMIIGSY